MLLTMIDAISCENPNCKEFARIVSTTQDVRSYYCQVCGQISYPRPVDIALVTTPKRYEEYLRKKIISAR